jgi:formate-dependent nitrite reductase membrane component NrfD
MILSPILLIWDLGRPERFYNMLRILKLRSPMSTQSWSVFAFGNLSGLIAARQALDDPITADHLRRTRPRIERLLGLLAHRYGARKSRYIGSAKARFQALWAAALVNLNPIGRRLAAQPR